MYCRFSLVACLTLARGACASVPIAAVTSNGHIFRGTYAPSHSAEFQISDGRVTCTGTVRLRATVVVCDHGLKGGATFKEGSVYNSGFLRLSDGTEGTFVAGDEAAKL